MDEFVSHVCRRLSGWFIARGRIAGLSALLASLTMHALLVVVWQLELSNTLRRTRDPDGGHVSHTLSEGEPSTLTILLADNSLISEKLPSVSLAPHLTSIRFIVDPTEVDPPRFAEDDDPESAVHYGKYVEQVQSRIEQAWLRPRAAIGDNLFQCRARIQQDRAGSILEIMLEECNGTLAWQRSLVMAIQSASPLPVAPAGLPEPDAFTLTFRALEYIPGGSPDGFEPAPVSPRAVAASIAANHSILRRRPD